MRHRALHFCFLLTALVAPSLPALARECPPFREPTVKVVPLTGVPEFDTMHNLSEMRVMVESGRENFSSTDHEIPVGLTAASLKLESHFEVVMHKPPFESEVCAQISHFEMRFGFNESTVYLAKELPYGSCSYKTVMEHELRHVDTDRALVRKYADLFPDTFMDMIEKIGVIQASSPDEAQMKLRDIVKDYTTDLGRNLTTVREKFQKEIDTKDEYSRISKSCNGELSRILATAARKR